MDFATCQNDVMLRSKAAAERVASERGEFPGASVGYAVRGEEVLPSSARHGALLAISEKRLMNGRFRDDGN